MTEFKRALTELDTLHDHLKRLIDISTRSGELNDRVVTLGRMYDVGQAVLDSARDSDEHDTVRDTVYAIERELLKCSVPTGPNALHVITLTDILKVNAELSEKLCKKLKLKEDTNNDGN